MSTLFMMIFGGFWREWLGGIVLLSLLFGEWKIYDNGYQHCEAEVKASGDAARAAAALKALGEQQAMQAASDKALAGEQAKTNAAEEKYHALLQTPHVDCHPDPDELRQYDATIQTYHPVTPPTPGRPLPTPANPAGK